MGFLDDCATTARMIPQRKASEAMSLMSKPYQQRRGLDIPEDFSGHVKAFKVISTICDCITRIAIDAASCPLRIWQKPSTKNSQRMDVTEAPGFKVFSDPNPHQTTIEHWRLSISFMELFGQNYWELVSPASDKRVAEMYSWTPLYMRPIPDPKSFVSGYLMDPRDGRQPKHFTPEEMLWIRYPDPTNLYGGLSPLRALRRDVMLFDSAGQWASRTFKNDVRPSVIVKHKQTLDKEQAEVYKTRFRDEYSGEENAYRAMLLDQDVDVEVVKTSMKDLEFSSLLGWTKQQVFTAFHIPPAAMGVFNEAAVRANTEDQLKWYWQTTVIPKLLLFARIITEYMLPRWGDPFEAEFDTSHVEVLKDNEDAKHVRLKDQLAHMVITPNDWREEIGRDRLDAPGMDDLYLNTSLYPVSSANPQRAAEIEADREAEANAPAPSELAPTGEEEE